MVPKMEVYLSEFIGTFYLVLTVSLCVGQGVALAPVAIGSVLMVMIFSLGFVSGAHFNPAVTVAIFLSGRKLIRFDDVIKYIISQCLGGFVAGFVGYRIIGKTIALEPVGDFGTVNAFFVEVVFTCLLCFVVLNVATTEAQKNNHYFGLSIGFTVLASAFAIGGISGCCLNPAVFCGLSLNHAVFKSLGVLIHTEVYVVAPLLGAMIASGMFRLVRYREYKPKAALDMAGMGGETPLVE